MTRGLPPTGHVAEENELLARLGLPASASPEDVDELHQAVSQFLAAAPSSIRGWAHAQASALDQAYLQLTDPVGFGDSALRSPARPPMVVPGGPATPPARRGPIAPAVGVAAIDATAAVDEGPDAEAGDGAPDVDDLAALYASVTPSVHRDTLPGARPTAAPAIPANAPVVRRSPKALAAAELAARQNASNPWKRLVIGFVAIAAIVGIGIGVYQAGGGGQPTAANDGNVARASATAPAVDAAKVAALMAKYQANPQDTTTLMDLGNEFYAGQQFDVAAQWFDKLLGIDPNNIKALLARGAVSFNLNDLKAAETTWKKVVGLDPKNVEVHYDLGFLYLNQTTPDWAGVQREWNLVVELDPTSNLAQTVKSHLDSLAASSMIPAASGGSSPAPSSSPAATAGASAAPSGSPVSTPAASPAASGSPAASTQP